MSTNKYKSLLSDVGIFAIGNLGSKILNFLFVSLYTACLTTEEYGSANLVVTSVSLIFPVLTMAISEPILRFTCDNNENKNSIYSIGATIILLATILNTVVAILVSAFVPEIKNYILYYIILFFLTSLELSMSNFIKGINKIKVFAAKGILYSAVFIVSNIVFLTVLDLGLEGYFYAMIMAYILSILMMFIGGHLWQYKWSFKLDTNLLRRMLRYSIPMIPATIAWWINSSSDSYMITLLAGVSYTGMYSVAHKIPSMVTSITGIFTQAWQLSAMKNYDSPQFSSFFSNIFNSICYLLIIGSTFVIFCTKIIAVILFQKEFYIAWKYVPMLMVAAIFSTIAGVLASAYTSAKKTNILFISTVIAAALNIILNFALIKTIGPFGAAIATSLSFLTMVLVRLIFIKKIVKIEGNWKSILPSCIILFITSIMLVYLDQHYWVIVTIMFITIVVINFKSFTILIRKMFTEFNR